MTNSEISSIVLPVDLDTEMPPRVLLPVDPQRIDNIAYFSHRDKTFVVTDKISNLVAHYSKKGGLSKRREPIAGPIDVTENDSDSVCVVVPDLPNENEISNTLRNQFEFSDRSSQTICVPISRQGFSTLPPPSCDYNASVTGAIVFDAYMHALSPPADLIPVDPIYSPEMQACSKLMERIVNLNVDNDVFADMKYFEDKSDDYRDSGSLLPLWKFVNEKNAKLGLQVTFIKWSPKYPDLFAISYGSYEYMKQSVGMLAVYSLKNSKSPEILIQTESSVCCIDWNKEFPSLIAMGMYDGTVSTVDIARSTSKLLQVYSDKHLDPVWEVVWTSGVSVKSVSIDGAIKNWDFSKRNSEPILEGIKDDVSLFAGCANALCFDFNCFDEDKFLVGTEEGKIHLCLKYLTVQVGTWTHADKMAVYCVKWNPLHPEMFASASADWTVKLWLTRMDSCVCVFELGGAVGDFAWWNPFVFAAVTAEGCVFVFDLERNRNKEICTQRIVKRGKLTRIALGTTTVLVGDDRGVTYCLKLSPNLRGRSNRLLARTQEDEMLCLEEIIKLLS